MNWITVAVLGAVAAWFEYSYQRSRRKSKQHQQSSDTPPQPPETAPIEAANKEPSIGPGDENDKQLNAAV